jgi:hypothetical protein
MGPPQAQDGTEADAHLHLPEVLAGQLLHPLRLRRAAGEGEHGVAGDVGEGENGLQEGVGRWGG